MQLVTSEITVFTDANVTLNTDAISEVVRALSDEQVGGVAGHLCYVNKSASDSASGNGLYWRYEEFIKRCEGTNGSMMGADGSIFAIKSSLYRPLPEHVMDDFCTSMGIVMRGHQFLFAPSIRALKRAPKNLLRSFSEKCVLLTDRTTAFVRLAP